MQLGCRFIQKDYLQPSVDAFWTLCMMKRCSEVLRDSPVDIVDEVLNHPIDRVRHFWQQEATDGPVAVPIGYRAALVTVRTWHLGGLSAKTPGRGWLWKVPDLTVLGIDSDSPEPRDSLTSNRTPWSAVQLWWQDRGCISESSAPGDPSHQHWPWRESFINVKLAIDEI